MWGLVFLALFATFLLRDYSLPWRDEMVLLLPLVTLFAFVCSQTGFSVHSRYIIPSLPFLFIWISRVAKAFTAEHYSKFPRSTLAMRCLTAVFLGWMIMSSVAVYPHSLSYFSELAALLPTPCDDDYPMPPESTSRPSARGREGLLTRLRSALTVGPRYGPRHLLDSNIDWGQDLYYLERWYDRHPEARPLRVAYCGSYPLKFSKLTLAGAPPIVSDNCCLPACCAANQLGPQSGWYAVSVNEIYNREKQYRYFLHFKPVAMAGYSIYVYHIALADANRVRRELRLPELPGSRIERVAVDEAEWSDARIGK
jgi:hypothetical protein